jgi:hypothetical protein
VIILATKNDLNSKRCKINLGGVVAFGLEDEMGWDRVILLLVMFRLDFGADSSLEFKGQAHPSLHCHLCFHTHSCYPPLRSLARYTICPQEA